MAYGDYHGSDKPNKGLENGACNRQRCQAEPALWYNHGSHAWYCADCAHSIGTDPVNASHWPRDFKRLFPDREEHPMFERRQDIIEREIDLFLKGHEVSQETIIFMRENNGYMHTRMMTVHTPTGRTTSEPEMQHLRGRKAAMAIMDDPFTTDFGDLESRSLVDPLSRTYYATKDHDGREEQRALFGIGIPARRQGKTLAGRNLAAQICINGAPKPAGYVTSEKPLTKRQKRRQRGSH